MNDQSTPTAVLKESAIILAAISAVFYFWGFLSESFAFLRMGVPLEFLPERPLQFYLVFGGAIFLLLYLPFVGLPMIIVFKIRSKKKRGKDSSANATSTAAIDHHLTSILVSILIFTLFLPAITGFLFRRDKKKTRVKSLSLSAESKIANKYEGRYFVTKAGSNYVFVDKMSETEAATFIVNESEIKELVLVWSQE